ncbi:MAG: Sec-independent protein translocase subunit TatA [Sulfurovaceae bacterium]|nr:Sec-independent protein translocase subunit TatA [Sulfurovaceae bacterium]MDD5548313.1 Sec-independent protein translocase subunit TatA [Sulfurovaceae bacterium]
MGSFSMGHWLIVLAVIVLLFGAKKIPELAKGLGKGIKDFKEAVKEDEESDDTKELTSAEDSEIKSTKSTKTTKKS